VKIWPWCRHFVPICLYQWCHNKAGNMWQVLSNTSQVNLSALIDKEWLNVAVPWGAQTWKPKRYFVVMLFFIEVTSPVRLCVVLVIGQSWLVSWCISRDYLIGCLIVSTCRQWKKKLPPLKVKRLRLYCPFGTSLDAVGHSCKNRTKEGMLCSVTNCRSDVQE